MRRENFIIGLILLSNYFYCAARDSKFSEIFINHFQVTTAVIIRAIVKRRLVFQILNISDGSINI
jgi:hypothetical protein